MMSTKFEIFRALLSGLLVSAALSSYAVTGKSPEGDETAHRSDSPEHVTCFQFGYDWRKSSAANAVALDDFIEEKRHLGAAEKSRDAAICGSRVPTLTAHASARSASDRLATASRVLSNAEQVVSLSKERKEFGVGVALEMIQSGSDLARSRQDYLAAIADENKAQFALAIYTGRLGTLQGKK